MIERHQISHASELVKHYNWQVGRVDTSISLLIDQDADGYTLNETLEQLIAWINENCANMQAHMTSLVAFIDGWDIYDLTNYTNIDTQYIRNIANFLTVHADSLADDILNPSINSKNKLANLYNKYQNTMSYANPVVRSEEVIFANRVNIYIDAAAYTLRYINEADGSLFTLNDQQIKERVIALLEKAERLSMRVPLPSLQSDMDTMMAVSNYVMANIGNSIPFSDLADYIDANVDKTPLYRRRWAL